MPLYEAETRFTQAVSKARSFLGSHGHAEGDTPRFEEIPTEVLEALTKTWENPPIEIATVWSTRSTLEGVLTALSSDPDPALREEARLDSAYLHLRWREWDAALASLDRAEGTQPDSAYLAALLRGWADQRLGRESDAEAAYQHAVALAPGAPSASTLLAALWFLNGRRVDAYNILRAAFESSPPPADPWTHFRYRDATRLDRYLANMREALR